MPHLLPSQPLRQNSPLFYPHGLPYSKKMGMNLPRFEKNNYHTRDNPEKLHKQHTGNHSHHPHEKQNPAESRFYYSCLTPFLLEHQSGIEFVHFLRTGRYHGLIKQKTLIHVPQIVNNNLAVVAMYGNNNGSNFCTLCLLGSSFQSSIFKMIQHIAIIL